MAADAESEPDLVVLDVMLPGSDGLEVCRRIHAIARWVVDLHGGTIGVVPPEELPPGEPEGCRIRVVLTAP